MNAAASVMLSVGGLVGLGYVLRILLPHSSVLSIDWGIHEYYVPLNILGYWICVVAATAAGAIQALRAVIRDAVRLR